MAQRRKNRHDMADSRQIRAIDAMAGTQAGAALRPMNVA